MPRVFLSEEAERDIEDIHRYIATHDSPANADRVLRGLEQACRGLSILPRRGSIPEELRRLGIADFRETRFKPYRIIYRVEPRRVVIHCVLDGRRDIQSELQLRLVR